jgi:hypothetical protein
VVDQVQTVTSSTQQVFDFETTLDGIVEAYQAMNERPTINL